MTTTTVRTKFVLHGAVITVSLVAISLTSYSGTSLQHLLDLSLISYQQNAVVTNESLSILRNGRIDASSVDVVASRIWRNMTMEERDQGLERVGRVVRKYGRLVTNNVTVHPPWRKSQTANDTIRDGSVCAEFGSGGSGHYLCGPAPIQSSADACNFISFGISNDYSFDVDLANVWNCRGFAADPSVVHPSQLHPRVTFHNLRANTLQEVTYPKDWWMTSVPSLVKFLKLPHVHVLKMDCEGCEYALPRDILLEDPRFFHRVGQISLELHVSKIWIHTNETLYYFGLLFELLEEAGFELAWSFRASCAPKHEVKGCMPQFEEWGFGCGLLRQRSHGKTYAIAQGNKQGSCYNLLFARRQAPQ